MSRPFVGRATEVRDVLRAMNGAGAALIGPPGTGKSRLAAEVAARLDGTWCYATVATSTIPFGAFAALLPPDLPSGNPLGRAVEHLRGRRVLIVDDAHLLDDASVALLQHLIQHSLVKVLLTSRTASELTSLLTRFDIGDLSRAASDELLAAALGHVDGHTRQLLWSRTAGNPLYLRELLASGQALGRLTAHEGIWSWRGPIDVAGRLAEVVSANLGRLDPDARAALEVLAFAEPIDLDVLASLASPEVLDDLESRGLLRVEPSGVRLGHPLYGSLLRRTCPTLRAKSHQRALADRLESLGRREDVPRIAILRLDSDTPTSVPVLARAAEQAWMARDAALAERLCEAAIAAGGVAEVATIYGKLLTYARAPDEAVAVLAPLLESTSDPVQRARLGEALASILFFGLADGPAAAELLMSLEVPSLPAETRDGLRIMRIGQQAQYLPMPEALALHDELPDNVYTRHTRALCLLQLGRIAESLELIDSYEETAVALADLDPALLNGAQRMRCFALIFRGDFAEAETLASRIQAEVVHDSRWALAESSIHAILSIIARMRGHTGRAVRLAREGARIRSFGKHPLIFDALVQAELASALAMHGMIEEATAALDRAVEACRPSWVLTGASVEVARAVVLASSGDVTGAGAVALASADAMRAIGMYGNEVSGRYTAFRFGVDTAERLTELADALGDPMTSACAAHARARSPEELEAVSATFAGLGATVYAAEALASAAALHRRAGRAQAASQVSARQALLMRDFDVVRTPLLAAGRLTHLTPRQAEVAQLAAAGLTNQQIADKLHTSKRTVDNHLHAVYTALGVSGRDALRAMLEP
ncbi:LuxR family transcriptional regulator [Lentzea sp. NBRC 105346]|uniref:LuxR C-terminal-related transcriptional regulator n=1 Tax=Lentzea sp. NBRC 105346 TaxID=3032205 RepID=UPI0024A0FCC1|nr:LuxR C-terminal-related transcriptional regulator [Lentzea sp. NBRC 105346]GLZ34087.1 LuxR family transcriptional regulator [Lentzea sp. NBRC 105346]